MREPKSNSWIFVVSIVIVFQLTISVCLAQKHQPNTQEIGVTSYSLDHGLNEDYIKCTAQDSSGYIYVGTRNGLFKFDSYTFTRINLFKSTAKATLVHFIHVDQQGNVWVGTNKGIKRKKAKESQFESIPKLNYRIITSIYQEDENQFWLGTAYNNLASYNLKKDTVILYPIPNRYNLSTLMPVDDELMFIGLKRKGGVFFNRSSKDIINNSSSQIPRSNIENTIKSKTGRIFATCRGRLYELVNNRFIDLDIKQSLPENNAPAQLLSLLEYNDSTLWIGTDGNGLIAYNINNGLATSLKLKTSVPVNAITHLFKDKADAVWISTTNAGLLVNDPYKSEFTHWIYEKGNPTGLSANSVLGIEQLSNSKIILGLDGGGINIYNERTNTFNHFINSKRNKNVVRDVFKDSKNNIWVGGFRDGLKLFKPNKRNHYTYPIKIEKAPFNNSVKCFSEDYKGRIWIGTGERGVIISNYPNDNNSTEYLKAYSNNLITSLYESSDSTMWIGKINGLSKYNPHLNKFQDVNLGGGNTPPIHVLSITESEKHQIWVGTQIGLWHIDEINKDTIQYSTADGLPSSIVNGVLSDDNGDIWAATAHGLSQYKVGDEIFRNFGLVDGIKGQFSDNSALKASDGKLYFGGTNGVYSFYPEQIKHNPTPPTIQLVEMAIFTLNKGHEDALSNYQVIDLHNTNEITLNHDQNIFSISFTALNYTLSRNNKYKYQLVGFEEGWNTTKDQRKITYTRIPPGDYEFKVIAANNDGVWNNRGKSIKIKIKSPWYKTNTALIIWFLIILALIITINRFVILQMKLKNSLQMERMDKKMQEEANLNKIQFFTNITHELRSPLTLILGPLDKLITNAKPNSSNLKNLGLIKKNADRLLRLINQILEFRKIDQGKRKVKVSMVNIVLFIREICDSFIELSNSKSITIVFTPH
ncbi:MAG: hypothetical protein N4A74_08060, partial [Carboxylicivirga sp.]|nr:hypothetical protein [Carboxylicivirga sp.]